MSWMQAIQRRNESRKAISHRPDLAGRVHLMSTRRDEIAADANLQDFSDYARAHASHPWFRKAIKTLSDNLSVLPVRVINRDGDEITAHPLTELYSYCNDAHGPVQVWATWVQNMIIGGEEFHEIVDDRRQRPVEVWSRRPDEVGVYPDLARPRYPRAAGYTWQEEDYALEQFVQWQFVNPLNAWRGLSVVAAFRSSLTISIFTRAWRKTLLKRGGNPDVAIIAKQGITRSERDNYTETYIEKFRGWENWDRQIPLILEDGITDIRPLSFPPADMQWLEEEKLTRDEVGGVVGVPDVLMGYGIDTYDNDEKRKTAMRTLWTLTLTPLVTLRDAQLNTFWTKVRSMLKPGEIIATDLSSVRWLQNDPADLSAPAKTYWEMGAPFATINEVLGLGFPSFSGDDVSYLALNYLPTGSAPPAPMIEQEALSAPRVKLLSAGRGYSVPAYGSVEHRTIAMWKAVTIAPFEEQTRRKLKRFFQEQQNEIGRRIRQANQKQETVILPPLEDLFDTQDELARFSAIFLPILLGAFETVGNAELEVLLGSIAPEFLINANVRQAINYIVEHHAKFINETTAGALGELFAAAELEGASVPRMMEMLGELFNNRRSEASLERIARTVMGGAQSYATNMAWEQSGVVMGKAWLSTLDNRVRDTHLDAHGAVTKLGGKWEVGGAILRFPRDPMGPPQEIINCRCDEIAITYPIEQVV